MDMIAILAVTASALSGFLCIRVLVLEGRLRDMNAELGRVRQSTEQGGGSDLAYLDTKLEDRLTELIREGKKIRAIKELREARNLSLLDAKNTVEDLERGL